MKRWLLRIVVVLSIASGWVYALTKPPVKEFVERPRSEMNSEPPIPNRPFFLGRIDRIDENQSPFLIRFHIEPRHYDDSGEDRYANARRWITIPRDQFIYDKTGNRAEPAIGQLVEMTTSLGFEKNPDRVVRSAIRVTVLAN